MSEPRDDDGPSGRTRTEAMRTRRKSAKEFQRCDEAKLFRYMSRYKYAFCAVYCIVCNCRNGI